MKRILSFAIMAFAAVSARAQTGDSNPLSPESWPRTFKTGDCEVAIYQPQILEWKEYRVMKANAAVALKTKGKEELDFGALVITAETVADFDERTVSVGTRTVEAIRFPELKDADAAKAVETVKSVLTPDKPLEIPLDSMLAAVDLSDAATADTKVNLEPPAIFHSDTPAILVLILGDPKLEPVAGEDPSLMFVRNTNWDILFDAASSTYYLLNGNQWLTAKDLAKGPWTAAAALPESFKAIPSDDNWAEVKARLTVLPSVTLPKVFVSFAPAEILLTDGKPQFAPIADTSLMYVANTESDLFFHNPEKTYYLLSAGRWFSARSLDGPWAAATFKLPEDFAKIPANHPKAGVLVSVAGTPQADEAVIQASIPQTATVSRATATLTVQYDGAPVFKEIPGANGVSFAFNTNEDVFKVGGSYYCCHQGVWFVAPAPEGEWKVCDSVPKEIYTIPAESPKYNVTEVHVYDSTPETVVVGVTSGYSGSYVTGGLVMFGLGCWMAHEMWDDYWHPWCRPAPYWYGYGCGAYYRPGYGYCGRGGYVYGPYGGAGFATAYNPITGTYARGAYAYGPYGAAGYRAAYNPWTGNGAYRAGGVTPYGSWGRSAVVRNDEWARAAHASSWRGTVGGVQTSRGGAAIGVDRTFGSDGFIAKTGGGDLYVGHDGNIYRRTEDGWQKRDNGGWNNAGIGNATPYGNRPGSGNGVASRPGSSTRPGVLPGTLPGTGDRPGIGTSTRPNNDLPGGITRPGTGDRPGVGTGTRPNNDLPGGVTRPGTGDRPGAGTRPSIPGTGTRPSTPSTRPSTPATRPSTPATRPSTPATRPSAPATRPSTPATRPSTPATRPSTLPSTNRGYQNRQSVPSQLNRDAYSRQRSSPSVGSRSSGGVSRGGGASRGGGRR